MGQGVVSCRPACPFSKEGLVGPQPEGLLCILGKGALSEIDTWLMEHFAFAFLPSPPPAPSFSLSSLSSHSPRLPSYSTPEALGIFGESGACWEAVWGALAWLVSGGKEGARLCCGSRPLLPVVFPWCFQAFRVCSTGYCRFIKPQWPTHNARQERGQG